MTNDKGEQGSKETEERGDRAGRCTSRLSATMRRCFLRSRMVTRAMPGVLLLTQDTP